MYGKMYLNQPHPQGQQILWNESPFLDILNTEGSEIEAGSPGLVCGHTAMLLWSSHGLVCLASREYELTFPGVTWPVSGFDSVSAFPCAMLSNVRKTLADNLRK